jgi:WD40 repeat protein
LKKVSKLIIPVKKNAFVHFGQDHFLAVYTDDNTLHFYEYTGNQYNCLWDKPMPEGLAFNSYKHVSPRKDIYISFHLSEVSLFNGDLELKKKLKSPGAMIGLLAGGKLAVVTEASSSHVKVSVAPVGTLHEPSTRLEEPKEGAYLRENTLCACGRQDGTVAVIAVKKPFVDIYSSSGESLALLHRYQVLNIRDSSSRGKA